jgi:hypothetical protein
MRYDPESLTAEIAEAAERARDSGGAEKVSDRHRD